MKRKKSPCIHKLSVSLPGVSQDETAKKMVEFSRLIKASNSIAEAMTQIVEKFRHVSSYENGSLVFTNIEDNWMFFKNASHDSADIIYRDFTSFSGVKALMVYIEGIVKYVQTTGRTLFDAFRNITLKMDRRNFGSFNRMLIFSEEASDQIAVFDHFFRDHENRLSTPLFIAQGVSAAEVMGIAGGIQAQPSGYLKDVWENQRFNGKSVSVTFLDFLKAYLAKGKNPVVGVVRKVKKVKTEGQTQEYELTTEGAAVFVKSRLVGFLDGTEKGLQLGRGQDG